MRSGFPVTPFLCFFFAATAYSGTRYVDLNCPSPAAPYTNWSAAATSIQDAIDASSAGDLILVTNGTYKTGGRVVSPYALTNRVVVDKPVTVQSVNGSLVTIIQGHQVLDATNGDSAVRCVYMTNGASLVGFTLANGATRLSGHSTNEQSGGGLLCASSNAVVSDCVLAGNAANVSGGGAYSGTLLNCSFVGNSAPGGGGAYSNWLINCVFSNNTATVGGAARRATLSNCTLGGNTAGSGGAVYNCALNNCLLTNNSATAAYGGGAYSSVLNNCLVAVNSAPMGGGAYASSLTNCTLVANSAGIWGGGVYNSGPPTTVNNCIIYYNTAPAGPNSFLVSFMSNCCTTPLPTSGANNITDEPQLASLSHLSATSPCLGAGNPLYARDSDIDGEAWANPPAIGCDELHVGAVTGPLIIDIQTAFTNITPGFAATFIAHIVGRTDASQWEFGDGSIVTNQPCLTHVWSAPGDYSVVLRAYNDANPAGVSAVVSIHVMAQSFHFVSQTGSTPFPPYTSWPTAATNIQDAVDLAYPGATVVVSNGVYGSGGRVVLGSTTNRLVIPGPVRVQSVNGPAFTSIQGFQVAGSTNGAAAVRCVYLANGAMLVGFTLTNGATLDAGDVNGGGAWCESSSAVLSNCVLCGNSAFNYGGGVSSGTLNNCLIFANTAKSGGGTYYTVLNNCSVLGNVATTGVGGSSEGLLRNCIVYNNSGLSTNNYLAANLSLSNVINCCITPLPALGTANITNAPLVVDLPGGDFRLQTNSPCINAGFNTYAPAGPDLDGNPRIAGGTVDIGAYEFQSPGSVLSYAWLQQFGLPISGSADYADTDLDGMNNWQEWRAGTIPTNAASVLRMLNPAFTNSNVVLTWQSVSGKIYFLQRSSNLTAQPAFLPFAQNISGKSNTTSYTNPISPGPFFYRVGVQ